MQFFYENIMLNLWFIFIFFYNTGLHKTCFTNLLGLFFVKVIERRICMLQLHPNLFMTFCIKELWFEEIWKFELFLDHDFNSSSSWEDCSEGFCQQVLMRLRFGSGIRELWFVIVFLNPQSRPNSTWLGTSCRSLESVSLLRTGPSRHMLHQFP